MFLLGGSGMVLAGAAGSKPLAALPQLSSVTGRLAGSKVGEENLQKEQRAPRQFVPQVVPMGDRDSNCPLPGHWHSK